MSERFVPLGTPSIEGYAGLYEGHRIRFRPAGMGQVKAVCVDEDGMIVDELVGIDFDHAYSQAAEEWPGAEWINKEE